jgi:hypothetical protein
VGTASDDLRTGERRGQVGERGIWGASGQRGKKRVVVIKQWNAGEVNGWGSEVLGK